MKIFLGNAPWNKDGSYGVRAGSRWPHFEKEGYKYMPFPFFLAYATALLEKYKFDVSLVDGVAERMSEKEFCQRVELFKPDLLVLEVSTVSLKVDLQIAKDLKRLCGPGIKIALCGLHAGLYERSFLCEHDFVDFVLKGEYEETLLELAQHLEKQESLKEVSGLNYRDISGDVFENLKRPTIQNLDRLPWPARHFLPKRDYEDLSRLLPQPTAQMLASRGCPFGCVFCAWPQIMYGDSKYRTRSPIDIANEMAYLVKDEGFKSIYFDDDTFGIDKAQTLELCREINKRGLNIPWAIMTRADIMDEDILKAMADSGLQVVKYGVESGSQELVDDCGKRLKLGLVEEIVKMTKKLGIKVHLTFMLGLPKESEKTIKETLSFLLRLDPDSAQFSIATPFPGSRYYYMLEKLGYIETHDWDIYDGSNRAVVRTEFLTARDLERWLVYVKSRWQWRLRYKQLKSKGLRYIFKKIIFYIKNGK